MKITKYKENYNITITLKFKKSYIKSTNSKNK